MISLRQLRYFAKVIEFGSITRAAEKLHIAQPSLGVQIKYLEEEVQMELLARHSRGVSPTAAGKALYDHATDILRQIDALPQQVRSECASKTRTISLGLPASTMRFLSEDILSDAWGIASGYKIELVEERSSVLREALDRSEIDVILCYELAADPRLISMPILEEELLFVAAPNSSSSDGPISAAEILRSPLVLSGVRGTVHSVISAQASRLNTPLEPAFSIHSASTLKKIVMQGKATAVLPMGQVAEEVAAGSLSCRRIKGQPLYRTLYFARLRENRNADYEGIDDLLNQLAARLRVKLGRLAHPVGRLSGKQIKP